MPPSEQKQSRDRRPEPRNSLSSKAGRGGARSGIPAFPLSGPSPGEHRLPGSRLLPPPRKRPGGARAEGPLEMEVLGTSPAAFPPEVSPGRRPARLGTTSLSARSVTRAGRGALFFRIGGGGGGAPRRRSLRQAEPRVPTDPSHGRGGNSEGGSRPSWPAPPGSSVGAAPVSWEGSGLLRPGEASGEPGPAPPPPHN